MFKLIIEYINMFFMFYIFIYAVIFFISTISSVLEIDEDRRRKRYLNEISIKNSENYVPILY